MEITEAERQAYIEKKMREFAMNIDEFEIGQVMIDTDGAKCKVVDKTINSICVFIPSKTGRHVTENESAGIDATQWFSMKDFNDRFTKDDGTFKPKQEPKKQEPKKKGERPSNPLDRLMSGKNPHCQCLYEMENELPRTQHCFVPCRDQHIILSKRKKDELSNSNKRN